MTGSDRAKRADDPLDPWARGGTMGQVPASGGPEVEFAFDAVDNPTSASSSTTQPEASGSTASSATRAPRTVAPARDRRSWLIGSAFVAAAAIGIVAFGADDGGGGAAETTATPEILDTTANPAAGLPEVTAPRPTPPPLLAELPPTTPAVAGPEDQFVLGAAPREFVVDIAPELLDINPTEIVAVADSGLYEISLPSGRVRVTDLGFPVSPTAQLAVKDGGAAVWPTPDGGAQVVGVDSMVARVDGRVDTVSWSPGSSHMYLWSQQPGLATPAAVVHADFANSQTELRSSDWIDLSEGAAQLVDLDGALLQEDSGGTYRVSDGSTELLTTGDVVSTGANHLLVRECDAARLCALVSIDRSGERRSWTVDLPAEIEPLRLGGLSPGGDALLFNRKRVAADAARDLGVFELADGTSRLLRTPPSRESDAAWDTTGAGVVIADFELVYVDRFSGATVIVSDGLPLLHSAGTRRAVATRVCEVLAIVQSRFVLMAADANTTPVSPPPANVLTRLVELLPPELVGPTEPLITFVTGLVSAEVADSQTVANWPDDVQAGLDALDSYAAAECPLIDGSRVRLHPTAAISGRTAQQSNAERAEIDATHANARSQMYGSASVRGSRHQSSGAVSDVQSGSG
jgi:hypothetical protein